MTVTSDVLIIGSVAAGLAAALNLAERFHSRAFGLSLCCAIATSSIGPSADAATYSYPPTKALPLLPMRYDPTRIGFQKAPVAMITPVFAEAGDYGFRHPDGKTDSKPLNLDGLPFWIYAEYRDRGSKCQYDLIDGFGPAPYTPLPEAGAIPLRADPITSTVVRNCGRGFELVTRLSYDPDFFSRGFRSPYLAGHPPVGDTVKRALLHDYVKRLIVAFGGKSALEKRFAESLQQTKARYSETHPIMAPLASALRAAGVRVSR